MDSVDVDGEVEGDGEVSDDAARDAVETLDPDTDKALSRKMSGTVSKWSSLPKWN